MVVVILHVLEPVKTAASDVKTLAKAHVKAIVVATALFHAKLCL